MNVTTATGVRLAARGITRRFGSLIANDSIDLDLERGSIHAIVGGNGAGKTTLMRILQGMDHPDSGSIVIDGTPVAFAGPADAFARGIGMVHQEFMLAPSLSLLENFILACEPTLRLGVINWRRARADADVLAAQAGVTIDWDVETANASVHVRQVVEILRLLYRGVDVLILDEPTAVLAPAQVREFIVLLRRLRNEGRSILFISHKLDEVLAVADRITVLRAGRVVASVLPAETTREALAALMTGTPPNPPPPRARRLGAVVLCVERLGVGRLAEASLCVRAGEIVGIGGVAGNGQDELVAAIAGLARIERGRVVLGGTDVTRLPIARRRALGLRYLSADRAGEGLCLPATIRDNTIAGHHCGSVFCRFGILQTRSILAHVEQVLDRFEVVRRTVAAAVESLSGGNQQRVAIARELAGNPRLLLACQPTRGIDIAGTAAVRRHLLDYAANGGAVLLVSEDLDELISLADRIIVLYSGRVSGEVTREDGVERLGRLMLGEAA